MSARLDLLAGPNGAGKTTLYTKRLARVLPDRPPFINADEIAKARWPDDQPAHAYEAARIADQTRDKMIAQSRSFVAETVFSHASKLELVDRAKRAGYRVHLHAVMVPENLAVQRVRYRVKGGGHEVPERKIRERYQRVWPLLAAAARRTDSATFYDNSRHTGHVVIARLIDGQLIVADWPAWTPPALLCL